MWSPTFNVSSHYALKDIYFKIYDDGVANGSIIPFGYPMGTIGATAVLLFLLIPPHNFLHNSFSRYFVFSFILYLHGFMISHCKARNFGTAFGVGIICAWGILWSAVLLVFNDGKVDYDRIANVRVGKKHGYPTERGHAHAHATEAPKSAPSQEVDKYFWQSYPIALIERVDWVVDLYSNFRGVGWSWKIPGLPSHPSSVQVQLTPRSEASAVYLQAIKDNPESRSGLRRFDTYWSLVSHNIWLFVEGYLVIDLILTLMHHDPYFWGLVDQPPPAYFPKVILNSRLLLRVYRLVFSMTMIWMVLRTCFALAPLFFVGLLGPRYIGVRGEPWLYPDHFARYSNVLDRGLGGWWSSWWQQVFRYAFQAGGEWVVFKIGFKPKSTLGKLVQLIIVFSLSGCLHACGSMTMLGETKPWSGAFMFFFWQPTGILIEQACGKLSKQIGVQEKLPRKAQQCANFLYVHAWFVLTGPLLANEFAKGGLWLLEPLPFSPSRLLGLGVHGDHFWCWGGRWAQWHYDKERWWLSGLAI